MSSNPQCIERGKAFIKNIELHTDSWGTTVFIGDYKDKPVFIASVPMGGGGSGFLFLEMYTAGVECIIRYGSNDRYVIPDDLKTISIITEADNLYGLTRDSTDDESQWGHATSASDLLVNSLTRQAEKTGHKVRHVICHHLEDYHAFNYPNLSSNPEYVKKSIETLEADKSRSMPGTWRQPRSSGAPNSATSTRRASCNL